MSTTETRHKYHYELADRIHSGIKKLKPSEKTVATRIAARNCFGRSPENNTGDEPALELNKAFAYDTMTEVFIEPAEHHTKVMLKAEGLGYEDRFFQEYPGILKKNKFLPALEILAAELIDFSKVISANFAGALQEKIRASIDPIELSTRIGVEQAIAFGFAMDAKLEEFKDALNGAFQNAVASTLGLFKVLTEKLPKPKPDTPIPDWQAYTSKLMQLMKQNVSLLRNIGRFHFDVQNLFHNLQGIKTRHDKQVYDFNEEKFTIKDDDDSQAHLTFTDEFVDKIVNAANTEPCRVVDNGQTREFEFEKSAEGCPFLELETSQGNFFSNYCQWINKVVARTVLPNIEHYLSA